jgi:hypothetical protein
MRSRRLRVAVPLTALAAGAIAVTAGGAPAGAAGACHAGVHPFGGVTARTFCGPASATVKVGGRTFTFKGGSCVTDRRSVVLNIGTIVLGPTKRTRPDYFGLDVGKTPAGGTPAPKDGTYTNGSVVSYVKQNKDGAVRTPSITLTNHRTRGTFAGAAFLGTGTVSGSFRCR